MRKRGEHQYHIFPGVSVKGSQKG